MELMPGKRGQSTLIGFILLFGILVLVYSSIQAEVVPNQNAEIEYQHYQEVRSDMTKLYTEIITLGRSTSGQQVLVPVSLGTDYPPRLLFLNPPPAAGSIESTGDGTIEIEVDTGTIDVCDGVDTTGLVYSPGYQETTRSDIKYDSGLLYIETADDDHAMLEDTQIVDGDNNEINLYQLDGGLGTRAEVGTLPLEITGDPDEESANIDENVDIVSITLPSGLPRDEWDTLDDDVLSPEITVEEAGNGDIRLTDFEDRYTVNCYSVGLGKVPE